MVRYSCVYHSSLINYSAQCIPNYLSIFSCSTSSMKVVSRSGMLSSAGLMLLLEKRSRKLVLRSSPSLKTTQVMKGSHGVGWFQSESKLGYKVVFEPVCFGMFIYWFAYSFSFLNCESDSCLFSVLSAKLSQETAIKLVVLNEQSDRFAGAARVKTVEVLQVNTRHALALWWWQTMVCIWKRSVRLFKVLLWAKCYSQIQQMDSESHVIIFKHRLDWLTWLFALTNIIFISHVH